MKDKLRTMFELALLGNLVACVQEETDEEYFKEFAEETGFLELGQNSEVVEILFTDPTPDEEQILADMYTAEVKRLVNRVKESVTNG